MPRAATVPLSYVGSDGKRQRTAVRSAPVRQPNVEPGTSYNGITVARKYNDVTMCSRAIYVVACNQCQHVMHLKATNLHNANFACPQCEGKLNVTPPDVHDGAPITVDQLGYLVRTKRARYDGDYFLTVWHITCQCGRRLLARGDVVEAGRLAGCGACATSMVFRAKHGIR